MKLCIFVFKLVYIALINRYLHKVLLDWKQSPKRKPIILRGARQVGKTTLVRFFGKSFDQFLYFNLEKKEDNILFGDIENLNATIDLLFLSREKINTKNKTTLLFIDEVQACPQVIEALRYFHEDYPHLYVIVTGSLLEFALNKIQKVPVGRVQYMELHPVSFREYLEASGNIGILEKILEGDINEGLSTLIFKKFHQYALVGGMPEILSLYIEDHNFSKAFTLYEGIIESYQSDVEQYAKNENQKQVIRHVMKTAPFEIDNRVNLNRFGHSSFSSQSIKEAIYALENARLLKLYFPSTDVTFPITPSLSKRPRLHFLDIGLVNYQMGLHQELLTIDNLLNASKGKLVQQIVYQELKANSHTLQLPFTFWVREENGKSSEVDIIYAYKNYLIPIEIKSGASGTLRSLHEFIDRCPHNFAIRLYNGPIRKETIQSRTGKPYELLNLPYYLGAWLDVYINIHFKL
jgi:uncharacterized protein